MITKTFHTGAGKITVQVPTDLGDITLGQMIAAQKFENREEKGEDADFDTHPFIPQLTRQMMDNMDLDDYNFLLERMKSLAHQIKYCYNGSAIPEYVHFAGKKVKVPKNLSIEPAGAFFASRNIIADEINRHIAVYGEDYSQDVFHPALDAAAMVLAHYFYCRATGKLYAEQAAEEFKEEVLKLRLVDALPIARHFFLSYPDLFKPKISLFRRLRMSWKRELALRNIKNSGITTR